MRLSTNRKSQMAPSICRLYEEFCGTNSVSAVKLRWHQRGFANATPDMLCAQSQRTICTKLPWVALKTAAKTRIEMEWRSRYGSANDMRSFLRSVSGASLIRIGVSTKNLEELESLKRPGNSQFSILNLKTEVNPK